MSWDAEPFTRELEKAVRVFDHEAAAEMCGRLVEYLYENEEPYPPSQAEAVLGVLRRKRFFDLMEQVANALILTRRATLKVRRQYAQALIDRGNLVAALHVLEDLVKKAEVAGNGGESAEARGLIGRAFKQLYVNANRPEVASNRWFFNRALQSYYEVYLSKPGEHLWPGINAVALLRRAAEDGVEVQGDYTPPLNLAREILDVVDTKLREGLATLWDFATGAEASVALDLPAEALKWVELYVNCKSKNEYAADAFEVKSTLRQLTEVWRLDMTSEMGARLLPILEYALLLREGGELESGPDDDKFESLNHSLIKESFEAVYGPDGPVSYEWWNTGKIRCFGVARIESQFRQGIGTGFLVRGSDLSPNLPDEPLLLTNAHVVCDEPSVGAALRAKGAVAVFDRLRKRYRVEKVLWHSPRNELDASLLQLKDYPTGFAKFFPTAVALPPLVIDGKRTWARVYIIGYPAGDTIAISQQDNLLLDHQDPRVHYRAPTRSGSSGSPVFNADWELLALHHYSDEQMPKLNGLNGFYQANQGIYVNTIFAAIAKHFA
jgi:V8-like Glu-specific endopeptidase